MTAKVYDLQASGVLKDFREAADNMDLDLVLQIWFGNLDLQDEMLRIAQEAEGYPESIVVEVPEG